MEPAWLEVTVETTGPGLETLAARLTMNGAAGLVIEDEEDFRTFLEQNRQYWDYVDDQLLARMKGAARVKFYVTDDADGKKQLETWMAGIDAPYATARLREEDWATSWQKYYKPMPVGERLYIVPEWEKEEPVPAGRTPLYLNPGLIFGTPPPACAWRGWRPTSAPADGCWIWAAAAASSPSPPCCWARRRPWGWTSTPRPWAWPMKTPP